MLHAVSVYILGIGRYSSSGILIGIGKQKNDPEERGVLLNVNGGPLPAGPLSEVLFPIDNLTKQSKGFAFVTYMIPENAVAAMSLLDGHVFQVS